MSEIFKYILLDKIGENYFFSITLSEDADNGMPFLLKIIWNNVTNRLNDKIIKLDRKYSGKNICLDGIIKIKESEFFEVLFWKNGQWTHKFKNIFEVKDGKIKKVVYTPEAFIQIQSHIISNKIFS